MGGEADKTPADIPENIVPENIVYVLGSDGHDRYLTYVGWTNDLARRLAQHNAGTGARSTRGRAWVVIHTETFATRTEAMSREWYLKRDRAFRKQLVTRFKATGQASAAPDATI